MKITELRIGNLVTVGGFGIGKIMGINLEHPANGNCLVFKFTDGTYATVDFENAKQIPLTEEWLLKFGFEKDNKWIFHIKLMKGYININGVFCLFEYKENHQNIIYVHQLQNLYFALTGNELELKK